ncbi:hypothetical protein ACFPRL_25320 [Pseudoclavibacter helvolus]
MPGRSPDDAGRMTLGWRRLAGQSRDGFLISGWGASHPEMRNPSRVERMGQSPRREVSGCVRYLGMGFALRDGLQPIRK